MQDRSKIDKLLDRITALEKENTALIRQNQQLMQSHQHHDHASPSDNEHIFHDVIESQSELICRFRPDGTLTFVNGSYARYFRKSADKLIGSNFFDLIPPESHQQSREHLASINSKNPVKSFAHPVLAADGEIRWQQWSDCGIFDKNGEITEFQSVGRDITDLKKAQATIKNKESKLRAIIQDVLDVTDVGLCLNDKNLRVVWCNKAMQRFFNLKSKDLIGQNKKKVIIEKIALWVDDSENFIRTVIDTYNKSSSLSGFECRVLSTDGLSERWFDIRSRPVKSGHYAGGRIEQYTDITHLKASEIELRESKQRFEELADLLPEAVFEMKLDGRLTYANRAALNCFGYKQSELDRGLNGFEMIHPDSQEYLKRNVSKLIEGKKLGIHEYKVLKKDGSSFTAWFSSTVIKNKETPIGIRGFIIDISELKERTAALELLETVIEQVSDAIEITDTEGRIQYVNPALEESTGYKRDEMVGKKPKLFKSGHHDDEFYQELWKTIKSGHKWLGKFINRKKDGSLLHQDTSISPVFDTSGKIVNFVSIKRDVSEEIKREDTIRHFIKMEAMATLTGGIAHDFNNILAGVMGFAELSLLRGSANDSKLQHNLKQILKGCNRAKKLIAQILQFSHSEEKECRPCDIIKVTEDAVDLLRSTLPSNIEIHNQFDSHDAAIIDPTQLQQVIMNLCTNAFHAMEDTGGQLTISISNVELSLEDTLDVPNINPATYVKMSISDTGHGMDAETAHKIFDPYFTTKNKDKGTGLGLSVVHGIVRGCGGHINVYSEPDTGTTFDVYIPLAGDQSVEDFESLTQTIHPQGAGEIVLFVDDEEFLVEIAAQMLERLGYTPVTRTSPKEALEAFRANPNQYDLVITDLTMPNITGDQLARKLKAIRPDIPILLCTGFSHRINTEKAKALGICAFLFKPIILDDLAKEIRSALKKG